MGSYLRPSDPRRGAVRARGAAPDAARRWHGRLSGARRPAGGRRHPRRDSGCRTCGRSRRPTASAGSRPSRPGRTWSGPTCRRAFDGLKAAARAIGGVQIQDRGTISGNLCNASPAADGLPNLIALDARVELTSAAGRREVPAATFMTGNRRTVRRPDELVTAVLVPVPGGDRAIHLPEARRRGRTWSSRSRWSPRSSTSTATVGSRARGSSSGACSEVPQRLPAAEARLVGRVAIDGRRRRRIEAGGPRRPGPHRRCPRHRPPTGARRPSCWSAGRSRSSPRDRSRPARRRSGSTAWTCRSSAIRCAA